MRTEDECPMCPKPVSEVRYRVLEGKRVLLHIHQDDSEKLDYCIERPDGTGERVELEDKPLYRGKA